MATLQNEGPKKWRLLFMDVNGTGERRQIRFTNTKKYATTLYNVVERLIEARTLNGSIDPADAGWLAKLPDKFYGKLVNHGLVSPRLIEEIEPETKAGPSLKTFLDDFVADGVTIKGAKASQQTVNKWDGTRKLLLQCFDGKMPLQSFTLADAKAFRKWMEKRRLPKTKRTPTGRMAENSMRQRVANCKTFFSYAVREELIASNPFRNQVSSLIENADGKQVISTEVITKVIDAAPDAQWRLLIALWRYAGLRKMEPLELTWNDVLWDQGKLRVRSPKTRHHKGCETRYVPLRDVEPYLRDVFEHPDAELSERIISRYSPTMCNMHKPFERIIEAAGFTPWPNLIKNLRLSCENEWLDRGEAPAHVIAAWIGHDIAVQNSNYAIVSDGHFEQFNNREICHPKKATKKATEPAQTATKRRATTVSTVCLSPAKTQETNKKAREIAGFGCSGEDSNLHGVTPTCPSSRRVYQFHHQSKFFIRWLRELTLCSSKPNS